MRGFQAAKSQYDDAESGCRGGGGGGLWATRKQLSYATGREGTLKKEPNEGVLLNESGG